MQSQSVQVEDRSQLRDGLCAIERRLGRLAQLLQFLDSGIRAFHDRDRCKFGSQHLDNRFANVLPIERLCVDLEQDQIAVPVNNESRQLVRFTENQAAGIRFVVQHPRPKLDRRAHTPF
jgi:hypothetical protein